MPDTARPLDSFVNSSTGLFKDNAAGDISAQDLRDFVVSTYQAQALIPGGRLTLTSATPVTTSDVSSASTLYYTPFLHNGIGLYDGTSWQLHTFSEISLSLSSLTSDKNYDAFLYNNSGTLTLELTAWTDDTTRATALAYQDGALSKNGALTRRYLGTLRTTSTTTTEDSVTKRFLWNCYHRRRRRLRVSSSSSHTYLGDYRYWNNSSSNRVEFVQGLAEDAINATVWGEFGTDGSSWPILGQNIDSTASPDSYAYLTQGSSCSVANSATSDYAPVLGYHYIAALDKGVTAAAQFSSFVLTGSVMA